MKIQEFMVSGYLHNGKFYEKSDHTSLMKNDEGLLYRDITNQTAKKVYLFNGTSFELFTA